MSFNLAQGIRFGYEKSVGNEPLLAEDVKGIVSDILLEGSILTIF